MDPSSVTRGFLRVKEILDEEISAWENSPSNGGAPDLSGHGPLFSWTAKAALLAAVGHGNQLIQPDVIGNGKGNLAHLSLFFEQASRVLRHEFSKVVLMSLMLRYRKSKIGLMTAVRTKAATVLNPPWLRACSVVGAVQRSNCALR